MKIGFIGLGKMGLNMVTRLVRGGHQVVAFARSRDKVDAAAAEGAIPCYNLDSLASTLDSPKVIWIMVPSGKPVDDCIETLLPHLKKGDIIIDGGNSNFRDSIRRHDFLKLAGIEFLDAGTSGGIWGLKNGYCMMVGGDKPIFDYCEPIIKTLAPVKDICIAGHLEQDISFKMIHNGIEYGMLQAYAEGFEILDASQYDFDMHAISHLWNQASVVRSWLLELAERMYDEDPELASLKGYVEDSGEGRWTVQEAINENVPAPVITLSLLMRFRSRQPDSYGAKVIAGLRNQFGGHSVKHKGE